MNELQIFENESFGKVRTVLQNGEPWFVAKDVCDCLLIGKYRDAVSRLDEDERGSVEVDTLGGKQGMTAVNEYGLYNLVLSSRKPEAKEFKRWITHEVIPAIRKHGAYMTEDTIRKALTSPDFLIQLATELKEEQTARRVAEEKIEADRPKVLFADAVSVSKTNILIGELAKILKQNGVETGQNRLFQWLRDNGYLIRRQGTDYNMPTQRAMEMGLFSIKESVITHSDGHTSVNKTVKVSGKGQQYFVNRFLGTEVKP